MEEFFKLLPVVALALIELWAAIPAGLALNLHPLLIGIAVSGGAILGMSIIVFLGGRIRTWLVRSHTTKENPQKPGLIHRIWRRYGIIGLGLLAPLLTGAPIGAALGMALGAPVGRLMIWMSLGIILWVTVLTAIGSLGWAGLESLVH